MATDGGLRTIFRKHLPKVHWVTIESGFTEMGIPDMNGCCNGREFWIENKMTHGWAVHMRPEQIGWLLRRHRVGGHAFIAVRRIVKSSARRPAADELYIFDGKDAALLKAGGLRGAAQPRLIALGRGGPSGWPWETVSVALGL